MGKDSKIEWTDHTFNPWWGCEKVSPACAHCYAEGFAKRTGHAVWGKDAPRRFFGEKHWWEPVEWNAAALRDGVRRGVFCASMADVFEDREDLVPWRAWLFHLIGKTPQLDWLLLTKRPENIETMLAEIECEDGSSVLDLMPLENVWLGTTVENQEMAEKRIPELLKVPARVHFLSCEPLLESIDIEDWLWGIDWVICGGESGSGARPMKMEWVDGLLSQCATDGVPFFFKQWGDFNVEGVRVGKKAAGRLLDGMEWNDLPEVSRG